MCLHRVVVFHRDLDFVFAPLGFVVGADHLLLRLDSDEVGVAFEASVLHHDQRSFVTANEARDVLRVRHGGTEHDGVFLRIVAGEVERIGHFTAILELVDATTGHYLVRELRFAPADVHRGHHMEEQVGGDAARIVPILAEAEEAVRVEGTLGSRAQPHLPIDVVLTLAVGARFGFDRPVPFAFH